MLSCCVPSICAESNFWWYTLCNLNKCKWIILHARTKKFYSKYCQVVTILKMHNNWMIIVCLLLFPYNCNLQSSVVKVTHNCQQCKKGERWGGNSVQRCRWVTNNFFGQFLSSKTVVPVWRRWIVLLLFHLTIPAKMFKGYGLSAMVCWGFCLPQCVHHAVHKVQWADW